MTVNVPPEKPIIINGDTLRTTEDREVEIKCVSRGGKPAATVSTYFYISIIRPVLINVTPGQKAIQIQI